MRFIPIILIFIIWIKILMCLFLNSFHSIKYILFLIFF